MLVVLSPADSAGTLHAQEKGAPHVAFSTALSAGLGGYHPHGKEGWPWPREPRGLGVSQCGHPARGQVPQRGLLAKEEEAASQAPLKCCPWQGDISQSYPLRAGQDLKE